MVEGFRGSGFRARVKGLRVFESCTDIEGVETRWCCITKSVPNVRSRTKFAKRLAALFVDLG